MKVNMEFASEQLCDEDKRRSFAARLALVVSMTDNEGSMPYMPQPGDSHYWSIDRFGNNYWVLFDDVDNLKFTLSCRYQNQAETLAALAAYVAVRLQCELLGPV